MSSSETWQRNLVKTPAQSYARVVNQQRGPAVCGLHCCCKSFNLGRIGYIHEVARDLYPRNRRYGFAQTRLVHVGEG